MLDGAKTAAWGTGTAVLAGWLIAAPCLAATMLADATRTATPAQELAGSARHGIVTIRPALAEAAISLHAITPDALFAPGSARLTPSGTRILDRLGRAMGDSGLSADRFRVEGHADPGSGGDGKRDLAGRRAQAVAAYLEQNCAIPAARLETAVVVQRAARRVTLVNLGE